MHPVSMATIKALMCRLFLRPGAGYSSHLLCGGRLFNYAATRALGMFHFTHRIVLPAAFANLVG